MFFTLGVVIASWQVLVLIREWKRDHDFARWKRDDLLYRAFEQAATEGHFFLDLFTSKDIVEAARRQGVATLTYLDEIRIIEIIRHNFSKTEGINTAVIDRAVTQWRNETAKPSQRR